MKEVTSSYNPRELETEVQDYWKRENIYARVQALRKDGKAFFFVDGPPYTTGHIHLGTAWNRSSKTPSSATTGCRAEISSSGPARHTACLSGKVGTAGSLKGSIMYRRIHRTVSIVRLTHSES